MTQGELWIDADDTLWENNVFFERAFTRFAEYLNHSTLSLAGVRDALDEIEHVNNPIRGYGAANFARNLSECFDRICERRVTEADHDWIAALGRDLENHPIELIEGVEETLAYLSERHTLMICTKGNPAEQQAKIDRSGLAAHFHHVRIVKEKNVDCYSGLAAERAVAHQRTWMIGNSPKSDINPALAAGLGAVYIPHPHTWHLEHQEVPATHDRLVVLEAFSQLREIF